MARKINLPNVDDLIKRHRTGESINKLAGELGVSRDVINRTIAEYGRTIVARSRSPSYHASLDEILALYNQGIGVEGVARRLKAGRTYVTSILKNAGVPLRNRREQQAERMKRTSLEERQALTDAAHKAVKGVKRSEEELIKRAEARYKSGVITRSSYETAFASELRKRGVDFLEQFPVGKYNCDFIINGVVVEIFGGQWHLSGRHFARLEERTRKLFDAGYHVIFALATKTHPINSSIADYILSEIETLRGDKSGVGQYRVIWGTPDLETGGSADDKQITVIFPFTNRRDPATGRYNSVAR